ncbi:MAG: TonB-dependent receptor [Pirellulaceae bacterium]
MPVRNLVLIATLPFALLGAPAIAQQGGPNQDGTLPPVVVQPPEETTTTTATPQNIEALGQSLSYPGLNNLQFGQGGPFGETTGVLRSQGSLFDTPFAADIVTRQQIMEKQAPDMFQALQQEVGVLMQSTAAGQASPYLRGLTGQQVLILVDGIRLNNSVFRFGPNQYFNTIDPGMVDHIEVLRGNGGVQWGSDAIGGTINVVTRGPSWQYSNNYFAPEFTQYFNTANVSPYSRMNVEGWVGPAGVFTGGSFLNVRDLDTGWDNFGRQPGTNYQQQAGDIKFNFLVADNQLLTFAMQHVELNDVPRSDRFPGYPGDRNNSNTLADARFFDPQQRDLMYVRYQAVDVLGMADAVTFTASYNRQRENQTRGVPTTRFQEIDVETTGLQLATVKDFGDFGKLSGGGDWYHDDVDSPFGGGASGPIIPDDAFYERIGAFVNYDLPLTQRLNVLAGARYELVDLEATPVVDGTPVFITPHYEDWIWQTGLTYEVLPDVNLVGSVSKGFRAPNLDELTANNPNVLQMGMDLPSLGLVPETSYNYEVGVKTNFAGLRTQSYVYWMDLNNNIVPISAGANQFERANQDSFLQGFESNGEYVLWNGWSAYGNYWYTFGENEVTGGALSRIPPAQGILGMRYRSNDLRSYFSLYTWMVRRQDRLDPVRDVTDERIPIGGTPGYATLNMRIGRAFGDVGQHRLSFSLENITDQPYLVHGSGVFGSGVTGRFGYTWIP